MTTRVKAHAVIATKIVNVQPLVSGGNVLAPDAGLLLVLDDNKKQRWLAEKQAPAPSVGDYLIEDLELHTSYIVNPEQFQKLFQQSEGEHPCRSL